MKTCSTCKIEKPEDSFYWKNKSKGIKQNYCKICQLQIAKNHYVKNKKDYISRARQNNNKHLEKVRQLIQELKTCCVDCGITHPAVLDFHHLDPTCKEFDISQTTSMKKVKSEATKCIVLCSNCHRIRHWNEKQQMPS